MYTPKDAQDWYNVQTVWSEQLDALRAIALEFGLAETVKWKHPCYTDNDKNILIISKRKDNVVFSFVKGALIDEPQGRFIQPGQDRSVRYLAYTTVEQIEADRPYLEKLLTEAVANERAGRRIPSLPDAIEYCDELADRMAADEAFREAFEALTPGRQRQYNMHFAKAKQAKTRESRIDAATERIFAGKGLTDCICGHSKRMPRCDGSHKKFANS